MLQMLWHKAARRKGICELRLYCECTLSPLSTCPSPKPHNNWYRLLFTDERDTLLVWGNYYPCDRASDGRLDRTADNRSLSWVDSASLLTQRSGSDIRRRVQEASGGNEDWGSYYRPA